jgi:two-component system sensor histidine kinase BaeS
LGGLAATVVLILAAAQQMFISDQDLGTLLWIMLPAALVAAGAAWILSAPIARDAHRISAAATAVAAGNLTIRTGVVRDDELGDLAREFDRMADRLAAVEKERAVMLSSISHDLRTPLAALRAAIEAVNDGVADDPAAYLAGMEQQVAALGVLVDDLQLHTRLASGTLELRRTRVDIAEVVDEAVESMRPLARKSDVDLVMVAEGRIAVDAEPAQLARVVRNLVENAVRHAPSGSDVTVTVGPDARGAVVVVRDEGPGFAYAVRDTAFDPFTRGDDARDVSTGSSGLGLAIARGIVDAHDGEIEIDDGPGGVVRFTIPTSAGPELAT